MENIEENRWMEIDFNEAQKSICFTKGGTPSLWTSVYAKGWTESLP